MRGISSQSHPDRKGRCDAEYARRRLKRIMHAIQLEQKVIAKRLGITPIYLSQLKTRVRDVSESFARRMEGAFGVSAEWLTAGEGRMLIDPKKAARSIDLRLLPSGWLDGYTPYLGVQEPSPHEGRQGFPVLDRPTDDRPVLAPAFTGAYVDLPYPGHGDFYCLQAQDDLEPPFRRGEYVLIERRSREDWTPGEVDGRVCVVKLSPERELELCELRVIEGSSPASLRVASVSGNRSEWRVAKWDEVAVFGVVLIAFRTPLHVESPSNRQTHLFD